MDGLDIFNVYVMGSIEMLTVFHFFTRFLKKKVKFIYYILFAIFGIAVIRIFTDGSIMELLVYVLLLMVGGFFICKEEPAKQAEKCTTNTDNVDREIEKLKEEKKQLEQQIKAAAGDKEKAKVLEKKLAQIEGQLSQKDNDTYRRQNAVIS